MDWVFIVLEKLTNVVQLQVSRVLGRDNWDVEAFLICLNEEIAARKQFHYLKKTDIKENKSEFTASSLYTEQPKSSTGGGRNRKQCVFCDSSQCHVITEVDTRKDVARKNVFVLSVFVDLILRGHATFK